MLLLTSSSPSSLLLNEINTVLIVLELSCSIDVQAAIKKTWGASEAASGAHSQLDVQMLRRVERRQRAEPATRMPTVIRSVPLGERSVLRCVVRRPVAPTRPFHKAARRCPKDDTPGGAADSGF